MRATLELAGVVAFLGAIIWVGVFAVKGILTSLEALERETVAAPPAAAKAEGLPGADPIPPSVHPPAVETTPPVRAMPSEQTPKARLTREDVLEGMQKVAPAVKRCGEGESGVLIVRVLIAETGVPTEIAVEAPYTGTPIGSCAVAAISNAVFPPASATLRVKYPFKL